MPFLLDCLAADAFLATIQLGLPTPVPLTPSPLWNGQGPTTTLAVMHRKSLPSWWWLGHSQ